VTRSNGRIIVTGNEDLLVAIVTELAGRGLVPVDLHTEQATLDDVFLALAGRQFELKGSDR
jgi:ABC-2 type transport system ATP-binding protein